GMGAAAQLAFDRMEADAAHVGTLWNRARELFADWQLNGHAEQRWKGNLNIRREGLDVSRLISDLRQVMISAGSACASGSGRPSHVPAAIGLRPDQSRGSIRLGFGRYTIVEQLQAAAEMTNHAAAQPGQRSLGSCSSHATGAGSKPQLKPARDCLKLHKPRECRLKARARGRWRARPVT